MLLMRSKMVRLLLRLASLRTRRIIHHFLDDGGGMDPNSLRKCMSLGYSSKKSKTTIGQYGNGYKTSTMRLGVDAIVFSCAAHLGRATQSVGLLSYTFLRKTGKDDVIIPMIYFDIFGHWPEPIVYGSLDDWSSNLKTILDWSPFTSKDELMLQFEDIGSHGTKILIYNLWLNDEGIYELSFDDDAEDIMLRDEAKHANGPKLNKKVVQLQSHISYRIRCSLRVHVSLLYLRKFPNFKIILRGKPVDHVDITDELKHSEVINYKPQLAAAHVATVETTIKFIKEFPAINVFGFNVYQKNRLIKPFWKVSPDGASKGNGVVGVLEANFIELAHDKQDFERSLLFIRLEGKLKQLINNYWKGHCQLVGYQLIGYMPLVQKEAQIRQSAGHLTNSQNESLADPQEIWSAAKHQQVLNLDEPNEGFHEPTRKVSGFDRELLETLQNHLDPMQLPDFIRWRIQAAMPVVVLVKLLRSGSESTVISALNAFLVLESDDGTNAESKDRREMPQKLKKSKTCFLLATQVCSS
ncbi:protein MICRORCHIDIA 1 [Lathyrus oleraceus]|uniref:protein MICRORCHIDIA 1 n=1 Tax=Pisum sativum TaxID=3888 RepID=UPI001FC51ED7|nr:protein MICRORCHIDIA 1-like [Pisum sativum]